MGNDEVTLFLSSKRGCPFLLSLLYVCVCSSQTMHCDTKHNLMCLGSLEYSTSTHPHCCHSSAHSAL